jgi:hypothetical protein
MAALAPVAQLAQRHPHTCRFFWGPEMFGTSGLVPLVLGAERLLLLRAAPQLVRVCQVRLVAGLQGS